MKTDVTAGTVHIPVLREEVFSYLKPPDRGGLLIDATLGEGGHSEFFLRRSPSLRVVGIDADAEVLRIADKRLSGYEGRFSARHSWFNDFFDDYPRDLPRPNAVLFDLGISMFHYEKGNRGFSFNRDEALDMRLEPRLETTAADIVNEYPEEELADLLFEYGEERYARQIAHRISREREKRRIETSGRLSAVIRDAVPPAYRHGRIDPATRSFQALRIAVNGELTRLEQALTRALGHLTVGGRIAAISFHSLEDRIVKRFFRQKSRACTCPPEWPVCTCGGLQILEVLTNKPVRPSEEEVSNNPASRSARLRVAEKIHEEEI